MLARTESLGNPNLTRTHTHVLTWAARSIWSTGQDQCATIKRQLSLLLPGVSVFLDVGTMQLKPMPDPLDLSTLRGPRYLQVDDLESIDALEEYVDGSQVIQIFVSKGYFLSKSTRPAIGSPTTQDRG